MRVVLEPVRQVRKVCGQQKYRPDESYRPTQFCIRTECDDGVLWYHTLTGAMLLFAHGEMPQDYERELVEYRFLVPDAFDERQYALQIRRVLSMFLPPSDKRTSFTILTTTDCNARCFYCYELNSRRMTMSDKTARDAADYILRVSGGEKVKLSWFGGEPLYNLRAIDIISEKLRESGAEYSSRMTSNGYLFDEEIVKRAADLWHVRHLQITIDGTKERYLKTKAYIYHDDSAYERVMNNIRLLLEHQIRVTVRLNMNRNNADNLMALCGELFDRFGGREGFAVCPVLLKSFVGDVGEFDTDDEAVACYMKLKDKLRQMEMLTRESLLRELPAHRCMADNNTCEVIMPDGSIGKCEHFSEADIIGTIYSSDRDQALIDLWKEQITDAEICRDCPMFPRCIELKKCAWAKDGCTQTVKRLRILKLTELIRAAYRNQKKCES